MDKEKFIKKAKDYGYSNQEINEMIEDYENDLKKGLDIDPTIFLINMKGTTEITETDYIPTKLLKK